MVSGTSGPRSTPTSSSLRKSPLMEEQPKALALWRRSDRLARTTASRRLQSLKSGRKKVWCEARLFLWSRRLRSLYVFLALKHDLPMLRCDILVYTLYFRLISPKTRIPRWNCAILCALVALGFRSACLQRAPIQHPRLLQCCYDSSLPALETHVHETTAHPKNELDGALCPRLAWYISTSLIAMNIEIIRR